MNLGVAQLGGKQIKIFFASRLLRIFIPFFVVYCLAALCFAATGAQDLKLWGIALIGVASHGQDLLGVSWSLDIELQFYLIAPFLIMALRHISLAIPAALIATAFGWHLQISYGIWTILSYLPCFLGGMLLYLRPTVVSRRVAGLSVLVFALAGVAAWVHPGLQSFLIRTQPTSWPEDWFGMVWTALLLPYLAWQLRQTSAGSDRMLGDFSYALYLLHWPVIALIRPYLWPLDMLDRCVLLVLITAIAALFFKGIDRPANRARLTFIARLSPHPTAIDGQDRSVNIIRRA